MVKVNFYDSVDDARLAFAVIAARHGGKWLLCKHRERDTFEFPGGHREEGEDILRTAERELYEETGALQFALRPVCVYGVEREDTESLGMLFFAEIEELGELPPEFEMERIILFETPPDNWTYPDIQPFLLRKVGEAMASYRREPV